MGPYSLPLPREVTGSTEAGDRASADKKPAVTVAGQRRTFTGFAF